MTNDELRALADALEPMAKAPRFEDFDVPAFCAWVRAQADAQPVAWVQSNHLDEARRSVFMARLAPTQIYQDYVPLYAHPAPAAPQAEPKREPLSDERIAEIQRAAYERAAQECESRATAPQGEDYLACYYACADAIRALGRQHD